MGAEATVLRKELKHAARHQRNPHPGDGAAEQGVVGRHFDGAVGHLPVAREPVLEPA